MDVRRSGASFHPRETEGRKPIARVRWMLARARCMANDRKGGSAIELAMVMPVFIAIVLATIEFGRALETWNDLNRAVSQAVRIVNIKGNKTTGEVASILEEILADYAKNGLSVSVTSVSLAGVSHLRISATLPFHVNVPFTTLPVFTLEADTLAPLVSPVKAAST